MKRVSFLVGTVLAGLIATGCVSGPNRSMNPLGHSDSHQDQATNAQFPIRSAPVKEEVDRVFEERYPGVINWAYVWGKDRWFDLLDVVSWDLSVGRGFGANIALTDYGEAGDGRSWGQRGRAFGMWDESSVDRGLGPFYWVEYERTPVWGTQTLFGQDYKYTGWDLLESGDSNVIHNDWSEFGASAHLFAVGGRVAASPIEAVDFAAGLFPVSLIANLVGYHHPIFDVQGDDTASAIEDELREEKGLGQ